MADQSHVMTTGPGIYFDGRTSARHDVLVTLGAAGLKIESSDGTLLADWPYDEIDELSARAIVLRLGRRGSAALERLEVLDPIFAAAIDVQAIHVDRTGALRRRQRRSVIGWSVAATVSLVLVAYFGIPAIASRLTPLVPPALERKLGDAVDMQTRAMLDTRSAGAGFECGTADSEKAGGATLGHMIGRLEAAAGLPVPLSVTVVRRDEANAIALPGGHIYVFQGLVTKAETPDEVAGVIAHEIGHVAHRDGTQSVLQAGGLSFLFGMLLGDFVGGGAVVMAARTVLQSSYSREAEASADAYGTTLMTKAHGDGRALATMLAKIGGATEPGMTILLDHPETKARVAAINRLAGPRPSSPFLDAAEWAALKRICAG
jgi:Zn-dependent protease with chaperone function